MEMTVILWQLKVKNKRKKKLKEKNAKKNIRKIVLLLKHLVQADTYLQEATKKIQQIKKVLKSPVQQNLIRKRNLKNLVQQLKSQVQKQQENQEKRRVEEAAVTVNQKLKTHLK